MQAVLTDASFLGFHQGWTPLFVDIRNTVIASASGTSHWAKKDPRYLQSLTGYNWLDDLHDPRLFDGSLLKVYNPLF